MPFDLNNINQSFNFFRDVEKTMFSKIHRSSETKVLRCSGLPIGIVKGLIYIAQRIAHFGEALIKGLGNLIQGRKDLAKEQLYMAGKYFIVAVGSPLFAVIDTIILTAAYAISPYQASRGILSVFNKTIYGSISNHIASHYIYNYWEKSTPPKV